MTQRSVAMAILGIVAVIAVVGLVLLFSGIAGKGVYGGEMRQGETPLRPYYEVPARYTSPVYDPDLQQYSQRESWYRGLQDRNICPDTDYPVVLDPSRVAARTDCMPSPTRDVYWCCPLGGQAGYINTGVYE